MSTTPDAAALRATANYILAVRSYPHTQEFYAIIAQDWQARRLRHPDLTLSTLRLEQHEAHELLPQAMEGMGG